MDGEREGSGSGRGKGEGVVSMKREAHESSDF